MAAERTTTPASNSKILTARRRRERKRIRVILPRKSAKCALRTTNSYNATELVARQHHSVVRHRGERSNELRLVLVENLDKIVLRS